MSSRRFFARLEKAIGAYKALALITFNTLILFVGVNVAVWAVRSLVPRSKRDPVSTTYGQEALRKIYPDLTTEEVRRLLAESWSRPVVYESYTHFKEGQTSGRFVNVDAQGFRHSSNQGPWPPDPDRYNVFLFGGSTTFGYGVPDSQTIASYLQEALAETLKRDVRVYNFGRSSYQSVQERILFEQLLLAGHAPRLAIFVDGLNDFYFSDGAPAQASLFAEVFSGEWARLHRYDWLKELPAVRAVRRRKPSQRSQSPAGLATEIRPLTKAVCERYLRNKQLIERLAAAFGVEACFVWQPVPTYKYDLSQHLFREPYLRDHWLSGRGYERMAEIVQGRPAEPNFLWCADLQESIREPLYIDAVHYSAQLSGMLARRIAALLVERQLVPLPAR